MYDTDDTDKCILSRKYPAPETSATDPLSAQKLQTQSNLLNPDQPKEILASFPWTEHKILQYILVGALGHLLNTIEIQERAGH